MEITIRLIPVLMLLLCVQSCNSDDAACNAISASTSDSLCGTWNLFAISGGSTGGGYDANFDKLKIDSDLNFEILDGTTLLASGVIESLEHDHFECFVRFNADQLNTSEFVDLISDNEKSVEYIEGKLYLVSDCCDRYNSLFEREE